MSKKYTKLQNKGITNISSSTAVTSNSRILALQKLLWTKKTHNTRRKAKTSVQGTLSFKLEFLNGPLYVQQIFATLPVLQRGTFFEKTIKRNFTTAMADQQLTGGRFVHLVRHLLAELGFRVQILFGAELALGRACCLVAPAAVHAVQLQQLPLAWRHSLSDLDRLVNAVLAAELDHDFCLLDLQLDHRLVAAFLDVGQRRRVHHRLALGRAQSAAHFDSFAGRRLRGCAGSAGSGAAIASVAADLDAQ